MSQFRPVVRTVTGVYAPTDLFAGFDPSRPATYGDTPDFAQLAVVRRDGPRHSDGCRGGASRRAVHDAHVTFDLGSIIAGRRVVGIMGGHRLPRGLRRLPPVAELWPVTSPGAGCWSATGGGPGAMEAAHLGAALSGQPDDALRVAVVDSLAVVPRCQSCTTSFCPTERHGTRWYAPRGSGSRPRGGEPRDRGPGRSRSSIPTWHFGHEPTSPFATHIAKLFQNSIREDGLMTIARQGLVFTRGSAGTLQEVFQDAQQNFYAQHPDYFSPMVFLDRDYWSRVLPVGPLLDALFATACRRDPGGRRTACCS